MSASDVRLGLVGCGRIAERGYVPAAEAVHGVRLTAVADTDRARCARAAPGVTAFPGAVELLASDTVDAVVVATTAESHLPLARLAAEAGLRSLVEKPPGIDATQAAELARLVPPVSIAFNRRFEPALERLRQSLPSDRHLQLSLSIHYRRSRWAPYDVRDDALLDLGPHLVDLARVFGGEVSRVRTLAQSERHAALELQLDRGHARLDCATDRAYREVFEAKVDDRLVGRHVCGGLSGALRTRLRPRQLSPLVVQLTAQLEAFAEIVRGGRSEHLATGADGLAAMAVLETARRSARIGDGSWSAILPEAA